MEVRTTRAPKVYDKYIGQLIIVYYRDQRGTDRKLYGTLDSTDGGCLHLSNGEWQGSLNYRTADITLVSTVAGWNSREDNEGNEPEDSPKKGFFRKLFRL